MDILAVMMAPLMAVATCRAAQAHAQLSGMLHQACAIAFSFHSKSKHWALARDMLANGYSSTGVLQPLQG